METLATKRIALIGPECTGKTELAQFLAQHLGVAISLEYAREYAEARANELTADDVEPIAHGESALLDRAIAAARGLVVHDTDLLSTVVYARHYYGSCPEWIEAEARMRCADHYLLLDTDLPWIADAARDAGDDAREDLFDAFRAALDEFACEWTIVSGDRDARQRAALDVVAGYAAT
jgi:NadR type nicotinamide-nucleotide adenylyltransferase